MRELPDFFVDFRYPNEFGLEAEPALRNLGEAARVARASVASP